MEMKGGAHIWGSLRLLSKVAGGVRGPQSGVCMCVWFSRGLGGFLGEKRMKKRGKEKILSCGEVEGSR